MAIHLSPKRSQHHPATSKNCRFTQFIQRGTALSPVVLMISALAGAIPGTAAATITEASASWDADRNKLTVKGRATGDSTIMVVNTVTGMEIGDDSPDRKGKWKITQRRPSTVACSVSIFEEGSDIRLEEQVANAPDCTSEPPVEPSAEPPPILGGVSINSTSRNGTPGEPVSEQPLVNGLGYKVFAINDLGMHCGDLDTRVSSILPPFNVLHATVIERGVEPNVLTPADGVSVVYSAVSNPNDPILTGINSAGSGPVASSMLADGSVFKTNFWGTVFLGAYDPFYPLTNPFTGGALTPLAGAPFNVTIDVGLPMPDVEMLHLHTPPALTATQQMMPGITGAYMANVPQKFSAFVTDQPFFINPAFAFGYVSEGVDWFEAAGIPMTAYDDFGRENPWPLYRVQAIDAGGTILATNDTVVPISGEANCGQCHNAPDEATNLDDPNAGIATLDLNDDLGPPTSFMDDDLEGSVPLDVSKEWAADMNILRLHDQKHDTDLVAQKPVVCQTCHYTPALDLAQLGPLGTENDPGNTLHNGRDQIKHKSMSNVMHSHHGLEMGVDENGKPAKLFPDMPAIEKDNDGFVTNLAARRGVLEQTCYQCHPGRRTDCLRGAMSNGGMLCQDCHGDMEQVGDDFTRNVSADNPGAFELGGDFYTNPDQPRVPWANEPGCGSCHTGDAVDNMAGHAEVVVNPSVSAGPFSNSDGIRLLQAYLSDDSKATPIVPTNKRFAEDVITEDNPAVLAAAMATDTKPATDPADDPRVGNPMLYRVSTGHEGIFCEACHGATHGIWPNKNPNANDNVAAEQLQGHRGTITECSTCHDPSAFEDSGEFQLTLDGPHGMHAVGSHYWNKNHKEGRNKAEENGESNTCQACHGIDGMGTVLSTMSTDRILECKDNKGSFCADEGPKEFPKGHQVGCADCHENEI